MCEFVSWIEYEGEVYYLTNDKLRTAEGKELLKPEVKADLCGHGAILAYYPELKGKGIHKEYEDFSTPKNFPKAIVKDIKKGNLSQIGICLDVLNKAGKTEYKKIEQPAYAEYLKIEQFAYAEYEKIEQSAYAEYEKIYQSALAEYENKIAERFSLIVSQKKYRINCWK